MLIQTIFYLREYLFPSGCGGCGEALIRAEDASFGLCEDCRALLTTAVSAEKRCGICGKPLITEKHTCLSCRKGETGESTSYSEHLVKMQTLFPYKGRFKAILGAYKFGKSLGVGNFLAQCLASSLAGFEPESAPDDDAVAYNVAWVPVPPRSGKIKKQGWDQIEYLAGLLKKNHRQSRLELPVCRCLKRLPSRSQKELNREQRGSNLKGRILCIRQPPKTAIIFDDVVTTGATLNACAASLIEGGAESVYAVCLFYD